MNKDELLEILGELGYEGVADAVAEQVSDTYTRASNDVIGVMCDRLRENGELIPSDATKIANMARNRDLAQIKNILAKATDDGIATVDTLLEVLAEDNDELADAIFKAKGIKSTSYINNRELMAIMMLAAKRMKKNMLNISKTTAIVVNNRAIRIDKAYVKIVNQSIFAVQQGMIDYNTAIRQTVMRMAVNGVRSLTYESGHKRRLDSAARMNILDGVRAFNQEYRLQQGEQFGADGVEISAHFNCAPDHIDVQGKQYSLKEFEELQASLERPIGELNCQHTISPIVLGISKPAYSKEELKQAKEHSEMELEYTDSRGVKHTTTGYGATQVQRRYELKIRQLKDQKSALERVGDSVGAKEVGKKLTQANKNYKRVSDELGLRTKVNRTRGIGNDPIKNFGKNNKINNDVLLKKAESNNINNLTTILNKQDATKTIKNMFSNVEFNEKLEILDERLLVENVNQLKKLEDKFGAIKNNNCQFEIDANFIKDVDAFAGVDDTRLRDFSYNYKLTINSEMFNDRDTVLYTSKYSMEKGFNMPCSEDKLTIYSLTHEYGHMIQDNILNKPYDKMLKEYNEMQNKKKNLLALAEKEKDIQKKVKLSNDAWDMDDDLQVLGNKLKKVDNLKEANAIEINNEISKIAKKLLKEEKPELFEDISEEDFDISYLMSNYGRSTPYEFFAEAFANSQCGEPNIIGKAMNIWLKEKGMMKSGD